MINFNKIKKKLICAEIGLSHHGSIKKTKKIIDKVSLTGADIVKFQTHIAEHESTYNEKFRKGFNFKSKTRYDYWKKSEFTKSQWLQIKKYCTKKNLIFLSSPFSVEAVKLLSSIGQKMWKIGSGEFFSNDLNNYIYKKKNPIIISTGMSSISEINLKIRELKKNNVKNFIILQCTSKYPVPLEEVGINVINDLSKKYNCPVGLSDHSGTIYPSLLAISDDTTKLIEVHISEETNSRNPDRKASINFEDLKLLCTYRDKVEILKKNKVNKNKIAKDLLNIRQLFTKSIAPKYNLKKGTLLTKNNLTFKKPGNGIQIHNLKKVLGKKTRKNISKHFLLKWSDIEKQN